MSVTTLPHMIPYEVDGAREDWWEFCCQLCDYTTWGGSFKNSEGQASEHLENQHPRKYQLAIDKDKAMHDQLTKENK